MGVVVLLAWVPHAALAQDDAADGNGNRPRWEAGFALGGGRLADYPGADQSHWRVLAAPVLIYRGPILRVDRDGIRGRLLKTSDFELDLSASAAFNVHNNDARQGMPDLDYLFGFGPQLIYKGLRGSDGNGPTLHLKTRALMSTDFHRIHGRGMDIVPEVRWRWAGLPMPQTALSLAIGPTWASRGLNQYFYEVEPSQATPTRPAYAARAGYLGTDATLTLVGQRSSTLSWFVSARAMSLHGSANADSPLLRRDMNFSVGAGVLWTPWQSQARASD